MEFSQISDFVTGNETLLLWVGVLSLLTFLGTLLAVPWMVVRIPHDYFSSPGRQTMPWSDSPKASRMLMLALKNLLGALFLLLGLSMLLLPGQGLLTILIGVLLLDFPGKFRFECWLIRRGPILRSVNWLRRRRGCRPLHFD